MKKHSLVIIFLLLASLWLGGTAVELETEVNRLHQEITELSGQVQRAQAEITDLKNQQQAINFVSEDLSARVAEVRW